MRTLLLTLSLLLALPAVGHAQAPSAADTDEAETVYQRGRGHFADGQVAIAAAHFRAALELDPTHERARSYLVECLVMEGKVDEARAVAEGSSAAAAPPPPAPAAPGPDASTLPEPAPSTPKVAPRGDAAPAEAPQVLGGPIHTPPMTDAEASARRAEAARIQADAQARNAARAREIEQFRRDEAEARRVNEERARAQEAARVAAERAAKRTPEAKAARRARRNPRSTSRLAAGVGLGGPAITAGGFFELRPTWVGAFDFGVGGFLVRANDGLRSAVAISAEAQLSPVPWRLTPLFGAGIVVLAGSGASATDQVLASLPSAGNSRVVPYGLIGVRYDFRKRVWFSVSARLAPSPITGVMPIPGARIGLRF